MSLVLLLAAVLSIASGCQWMRGLWPARSPRTVSEDDAGKKKKKPKEEFEPPRISLMPSALPPAATQDTASEDTASEDTATDEASNPALGSEMLIRQAAKSHHWSYVQFGLKANLKDHLGRMQTRVLDRTLGTIPLPNLSTFAQASRNISLPKGQQRLVEMPMFLWKAADQKVRTIQIEGSLISRQGRVQLEDVIPCSLLMPHQYYLVILSPDPARFGFVGLLPSILPPRPEIDTQMRQWNYVVTRPEFSGRPPLPSNPIAWSNVAVMIWDGLDVEALSDDQRRALTDWLHWGGQLVVNGPRSLDDPKKRLPESLMPAFSGGRVAAEKEQLEALNAKWSLRPKKTDRPRSFYELPSVASSPWEVVALQLTPGSRFVPGTANLIAERRVGRGRTLVTGFDLATRMLVNWPGYDGIWNACLLGLPPRDFRVQDGFAVDAKWADARIATVDPRLFTQTRFFSRDAASQARADSDRSPTTGRAILKWRDPPTASSYPVPQPPFGEYHDVGHRSHPDGGIAAWNDESEVAGHCRAILLDVAGIRVPAFRFVFLSLLTYLIVLVPVNWLVFRSFGRVEWAWIAAPMVAIVGALVVVRLAQLDVGFVRSQTEVAVLEMQPDYRRGHLTHYLALYSSLTTNYRALFDHRQAAVLPFTGGGSDERSTGPFAQVVTYGYDQQGRMDGFSVLSNSTGMLHAEQFVDLAGSVSLATDPTTETLKESARLRLTNTTELQLNDAFVVLHTGRERIVWQVEDTIDAGATFLARRHPEETQEAIEAAMAESLQSEAELPRSLLPLYSLATAPQQLEPGAIRLVAWCPEVPSGIEIEPRASQSRKVTFVIANLRMGSRPEPKPDRNLPPRTTDLELESFDPRFDVEAGSSPDFSTDGSEASF